MVDDNRANILGRNILPLIGVQLPQQKPAGKSVNLFSDDTNSSDAKITNWVRSSILEAVHNITENCHSVSGRETRVVCDASWDGIGCALEQETPDGWATIAYASRFLITCEKKYDVNDLELLAAVWAIWRLKYYLDVRRFTLITDHQALISALQCNKISKIYQSRPTR